jgi:hypothetical protein
MLEARDEAQETPADVIHRDGLLALAYWRAGAALPALTAARAALREIRRSRSITYWNQQSVAGVAEVMLSIWESAPPAEREELAPEVRDAVSALMAYGRVFPFAKPSALLWSGVHHFLRGRRSRALGLLYEAAALAKRMGMPYERAQVCLEIGKRLERGDPRRVDSLLCARNLFARLGASLDLARADEELMKS